MEYIFPLLIKSPTWCILQQVSVKVWFLRLFPEIFYSVKERKGDRSIHPLLTLADIPVPVGEMSRLGSCLGMPPGERLCLSNANHHFVYPEWHRKSEMARQGWALAQSFFLQAHPQCQQLKGSQLSPLNPQRNVLPFGEIPDNTHTL